MGTTRLALIAVLSLVVPALAQPSFDCAKAAGAAARLVCKDSHLAALDRKLADAYRAALAKAGEKDTPALQATQRTWIEVRDACAKAPDLRACVTNAYRDRIVQLQAAWDLVPGRGPFTYVCGGTPPVKIVATYFATDPPSARFERGGTKLVGTVQRTGSGARYAGPDVDLWEHQGEAAVTWKGEKLECKVVRHGAR
jgi:uncharacterized protein